MDVVHIITVQSNAEWIVESVKASGYPIHRAYLVFDNEGAKRTADDVSKILSSLVDVGYISVGDTNIYQAVWEILRTVREEVEKGSQILINVTDSNKFLCLACFIAAQISGSKMYMLFNGEISEVLTPPIKTINEDKLEIIKVLYKEGGEVDSINKLIELVEGRLEEHKKYMAQRARMSYHLNGLEEDGLVITERKGKNLKIMLTELGKAYVVMFA